MALATISTRGNLLIKKIAVLAPVSVGVAALFHALMSDSASWTFVLAEVGAGGMFGEHLTPPVRHS
jgi:hypothetical protein